MIQVHAHVATGNGHLLSAKLSRLHGDCSKFASANKINQFLKQTNTRPVLQAGAMRMG